jgi:Domain of unknown function (DUF4149)
MRTLTIVSIALWLGMLGFFAFAVAPAAFATLDRPSAARLVSAVLSRSYWVGLALGILGVAGIVARGNRGGRRWSDRLPLALALLMLSLTAWSLFGLMPEAESLRDRALAARAAGNPDAPDAVRFGWIHGLSTMAGLAVMLSGAVLLALEARGSPEVPRREVSCREVS